MKSIYDNRDHEKLIRESINGFYQAYYNGNRLILYSFLDTAFQRRMPLNYFLAHERFEQDLGTLIQIQDIRVFKDKNTAFADIAVEIGGAVNNKIIQMTMDYGGWKISGDIFEQG